MNSNNKSATQNLVLSALMVAMGLIIPNLFHVFGPTAGKVFLPMFLPVIFAGLILPMKYAILVSILTPIISSILTGMPPVPMLYFMLIDLFMAAVSANLLHGKTNIFVNVFIALAVGKTFYILALLLATKVFGLSIPFGAPAAIISGLVAAIPGFLCNIIFLPLAHKLYYRKSEPCEA